MQKIDNPEMSRIILNHLANLYGIKRKREGIHLSTLVYCLTRNFFDQIAPVEPTDEEVMLFSLGYGLQDVLTPKEAETPVYGKDGITFSPDFTVKVRSIEQAIDLQHAHTYVELKTTRMSSSKEDFPETWLEYIMGGCYMQGINEYELSVLHMLGCLHPATRVLKENLTWLPIGEIQAGDAIIGIDEQPQWGKGKRRKLRKSFVLRTQRLKLSSFVVTFSDGRFIVASSDHLWLENLATESRHYAPDWVRTDQLRIGSRVRQLCQTWEVESSYDAGYLAGSIDSEGSIEDAAQASAHGLRVGYTQKEGNTLNRVESLLNSYGFTTTKTLSERTTSLRTTDMATALKLLGSIRPKRLLDEIVWEGIALPQTRSWVEVVAIVPIGEVEVVGLDTTTKTLIAEGFVSHNSYKPPFPEIKSYKLIFTDEELQSNWDYLLQRKAVYEEALATNKPPVPFSYCKSWECKNCRYRLQCDAIQMLAQKDSAEKDIKELWG